MARPVSTDFLHVNRFYLVETSQRPGQKATFQSIITGGVVGFSSIRLPQIQADVEEIREGTEPYTHHVLLGKASAGEVELTKAAAPSNADFFIWMQEAIYGGGAARRDFAVYHLSRVNRLLGAAPSRMYILEGCIPTAYSLPELDASSGDVAVESLTMHAHHVRVEPLRPTIEGAGEEFAAAEQQGF